MSKTKYNAISPDGFLSTCEPFASEKEALKAIPAWCQLFKKQGYYSTSGRQRIPLKELRDYLSVVPVSEEDSHPVCCNNCHS